jgi:predicted enzyme related to lactoylglutathione lyase
LLQAFCLKAPAFSRVYNPDSQFFEPHLYIHIKQTQHMFTNTKAFSGFSVDDTTKAKQFYTDVLGLDVSENTKMGGILTLNISGTKLIVYPKPDHQPATYTVLNFPVTDIKDIVTQLKAKGVKFESYDMPNFKTDDDDIFRGGGPRIAWFKDPAGNIFSVIEQ